MQPQFTTLLNTRFETVLNAAEDADARPEERAQTPTDIAIGIQARPKSPQQLRLNQRHALIAESGNNRVLLWRLAEAGS